MKAAKQLSFFGQGEDLPLFSGTAPVVRVGPPAPEPAGTQEPLPVRCRTCRDTGKVGASFCWCEAGEAARFAKEAAARVAAAEEPVAQAIRQLSAGVVASISGLTRYEAIDVYREGFARWAERHADPSATWQQAHQQYQYRQALAGALPLPNEPPF